MAATGFWLVDHDWARGASLEGGQARYELPTPDVGGWRKLGTDIFSTTNGPGGDEDLGGLNGSGRYLRLFMTENAGGRYVIFEIEVYCPAAPQPDITVSPSSFDYGSVPINGAASQTFVVGNDGSAVLSVSDVTLVGGDASEFNIDSGDTPFNLNPGEVHNVKVSFNPTSDGGKSTALRLLSDDLDEDTLEIPLVGNIPVPPCDDSVNLTFGAAPTASTEDNPASDATDGDLESSWRSDKIKKVGKEQWPCFWFSLNMTKGFSELSGDAYYC